MYIYIYIFTYIYLHIYIYIFIIYIHICIWHPFKSIFVIFFLKHSPEKVPQSNKDLVLTFKIYHIPANGIPSILGKLFGFCSSDKWWRAIWLIRKTLFVLVADLEVASWAKIWYTNSSTNVSNTYFILFIKLFCNLLRKRKINEVHFKMMMMQCFHQL